MKRFLYLTVVLLMAAMSVQANDYCGIAEYKDGLYWLYVSPASETGGAIQLRFYSPDLKRIFEATEIIPYSNNAMIGEVEDPYTPTWVVK